MSCDTCSSFVHKTNIRGKNIETSWGKSCKNVENCETQIIICYVLAKLHRRLYKLSKVQKITYFFGALIDKILT